MAEAYQGDDALAASLRAIGLAIGVDAVRDIIAGVVSALAGRATETWIELIAPEADDALRRQLAALKDEIAAVADPGFGPGPAPADRLADLRREIERRGLNGFLVPRGDAYQSEYVPARVDRMRWLTGFTGSAGLVVVLEQRAVIFVDGRYTLQVRAQMDPDLFESLDLSDDPPAAWIAANLPEGGRLGYDPWLHTERQIQAYAEGARRAAGTPEAVADNPLDAVWRGQPALPIGPVVPHELRHAGVASTDKRTRVATDLAHSGVDAAVVTAPDSIAWLLNIRGSDVPRSPLPLSWAIVRRDGAVELFIDPRKLTPAAGRHLAAEATIHAPGRFGDALEALGRSATTVQVDSGAGGPALERELGVAAGVVERLRRSGATIVYALDPCARPKAEKNDVEIAGARNAHRRDGAAMARFLAWMNREAPKGRLTELEAANRLDQLRSEVELFVEPSFSTISGSGPNAALPHYRPTAESDRSIRRGDLYLCDSGGQYMDGTTDVTRTIAVGDPTAEMRDRFTRVLKSHIALATTRFPRGTRGGHLDGVARRSLWEVGLDFNHGTGHGVGSFLNVHEGPQSISKAPNSAPFGPGMIVSNEPGYYESGAFGVRIENLIVALPSADPSDAELPFLAFETLTVVPIDAHLVEPALLTAEEADWLDRYHRWVLETVAPLVDDETAAWIEKATRPLDAWN